MNAILKLATELALMAHDTGKKLDSVLYDVCRHLPVRVRLYVLADAAVRASVKRHNERGVQGYDGADGLDYKAMHDAISYEQNWDEVRLDDSYGHDNGHDNGCDARVRGSHGY